MKPRLLPALLAAAVAGLFAATQRGLQWGEAWHALSAQIPLSIVALLVGAMALAELGRAAGADRALAQIARSKTGPFWRALAPLLLDLADPAAADRTLSPDSDPHPHLRRVAAACAVAGGTFGGTVWLGLLIASEAVLTTPLDLLLLLRLLVWCVCGVLAISTLRRHRPSAGAAQPAAPSPATAPAWTGWAALALLFATATLATLNPGRVMPVEAWLLGGAGLLWLLRPLERLLAWTFKREAVLPNGPSLTAMTAIVPGAGLLCAGLLAGGAWAAALPAVPAPVVSTLLAAAALPLAHCSAAYGPAGAVLLGVVIAAGPVLGPLAGLARARRGDNAAAPVP